MLIDAFLNKILIINRKMQKANLFCEHNELNLNSTVYICIIY